MATIRILNLGISVPIEPSISILVAFQRQGVKISHTCGGKTQCGTCAVKIVSGGRFTSPVLDREAKRLNALGLGPEFRLACQCYCFKDIEIEIPEIPKESR